MAAQSKSTDKHFSYASSDGHFKRQQSEFRNVIPSDRFPAEAGRYALYINYGCPWAHRTNIIRSLKGLEDIIEFVEVDNMDPGEGKGWQFSGTFGPAQDPHTGAKYLREMYLLANPDFNARPTVPMLWDKKTSTVVNNESGEILRMLITAFDDLLPPESRESTKGAKGLRPPHLADEIDALNELLYDRINNGVYKCGFASTQAAYDENVYPLFETLDALEARFSDSNQPAGPFLFGEFLTESDIRLYPTLVRFDVGYYMLMKVNIKMIRHDYPHLYKYLRTLYWDQGALTHGGAFHKTTKFDRYKLGYKKVTGEALVPAGPLPNIHPL